MREPAPVPEPTPNTAPHTVRDEVPESVSGLLAEASSPRLDELLCFLVYSTGFAFNRIYRKPLEGLGLTYPQYLVMVVLWAEDGRAEESAAAEGLAEGLTVGGISERLRLDSSTLTPLLKRLEALGHVTRARSAEDERRVVVRLTARGRALRAGAGAVTECVTAAVGLDREEVAALVRRMQTLRDHLEGAAA